MSWTLWFVLLSGWPVFLVCTAVTVAGMLGLSVLMTRMTGQSALRNMVVGLAFLTIITAAILALVVVMTRT